MKLLRYGPKGKEKPGLLDKDGKIRDLSGVIADINGETISPKSLARLRKIKPDSLPLVKGKPRIGACGHRLAGAPLPGASLEPAGGGLHRGSLGELLR